MIDRFEKILGNPDISVSRKVNGGIVIKADIEDFHGGKDEGEFEVVAKIRFFEANGKQLVSKEEKDFSWVVLAKLRFVRGIFETRTNDQANERDIPVWKSEIDKESKALLDTLILRIAGGSEKKFARICGDLTCAAARANIRERAIDELWAVA